MQYSLYCKCCCKLTSTYTQPVNCQSAASQDSLHHSIPHLLGPRCLINGRRCDQNDLAHSALLCCCHHCSKVLAVLLKRHMQAATAAAA